MSRLRVIAPGPFATIQDLGRPGLAHLGVPRSGAADRRSMALANRLVGNTEGAATIESTMGGLVVVADTTILVAVSGAQAAISVDGTPVGLGSAVRLPAGAQLRIETPTWGCRNYLGVRGGIDVSPVLGSRCTDSLSGLGPDPLSAGTLLDVGDDADHWPTTSVAPLNTDRPAVSALRTVAGPRPGRLRAPEDLFIGEWEVTADSNRVGARLRRLAGSGAPLLAHRPDPANLRSEGIAHGSVQVPPAGAPVVFLADHPVTGGYPVVAVLTADALDLAGQLVAGMWVRFER